MKKIPETIRVINTKLQSLLLLKFLVVLSIPVAVLLGLIFNPSMTRIDDNCHYMNVGRAIYTGQGYKDISIEPPTLERHVTPGIPFIASLFMRIYGHYKPVVPIKIFMMLCFMVSILIASYIFIVFFNVDRWIVLFFALITPLNVSVSYFSTMILTYSPYILANALVILFLLKFRKSEKTKHFVLALVFTLLAIVIRFPGIPIFFTGAIWFFIIKKWKYGLIYSIVILIPVALWFSYIKNAEAVTYLSTQLDSPQKYSNLEYLVFLAEMIYINLSRFFLFYVPQVLSIDPGWELIRHQSAFRYASITHLLSGAVFSLVLVFAFIRRVIKKEMMLPFLFVLVYFISLSPFRSNTVRYSTYLAPWLFLTVIVGFRDFFELKKVKPCLQGLIVSLFFAIQASYAIPSYSALVSAVGLVRKTYTSPYRIPDGVLDGDFFEHENIYWNIMKAYEWCRDSLDESTNIAGFFVRSGAYYLERPVFFSRDLQEPANIINSLAQQDKREAMLDEYTDIFLIWLIENNVNYVIYSNDANPSLFLRMAIHKYRPCFSLRKIFKTNDPGIEIMIIKLDLECLQQAISESKKRGGNQ